VYSQCTRTVLNQIRRNGIQIYYAEQRAGPLHTALGDPFFIPEKRERTTLKSYVIIRTYRMTIAHRNNGHTSPPDRLEFFRLTQKQHSRLAIILRNIVAGIPQNAHCFKTEYVYMHEKNLPFSEVPAFKYRIKLYSFSRTELRDRNRFFIQTSRVDRNGTYLVILVKEKGNLLSFYVFFSEYCVQYEY